MRLFQILRIENDHVRGLFGVDEHSALAIGDREFGLIAQGNRADDRAVRGVDYGGVLAAAIEGEDAFGGGIIDDGIGVSAGLGRAERLESLCVEDRDGVASAVADETAAEIGSNGDAMHAWRIGDVAFNGVGVGVHDDNVRGVRDVDAAGVAIDIDVVPALIARNGNSFDYVIAGGAGLGGSLGKYRGGKKSGGEECSEANEGEVLAHGFLFSFRILH